jgi:hypothetical protein
MLKLLRLPREEKESLNILTNDEASEKILKVEM